MDQEIQKLLVDCQDVCTNLIKCETEFAKKQAAKVQKYTTQLESKDISIDEFCTSIKDLADLSIIELARIEVVSKAQTQKIFEELKKIVAKFL